MKLSLRSRTIWPSHFGAAIPSLHARGNVRNRLLAPVAVLLLSGAAAFGQTFEWVNHPFASSINGGADEGQAIARDASNNVYVTGFFAGTADFDPGPGTANLVSAGFQDIYIAKYDASGNYLWANRIGDVNQDIGYGIAVDGSGNVYVTGSFFGTADFDPGPGTANLSATLLDIFIAKYDASGNYLWANRVGSAGYNFGYGLALDGSGNVHVTGYFQGANVDFDPGAGTANLSSAGGSSDIFIAKYDASGNYLWAKRMGGTGLDIGYGLAVDGSGNVNVTGYFQGANVDFDPGAGTANLSSASGSSDIFIAKYDASGNYVWANRIGSSVGDEGYGIALDGSGNVHVTGVFQGTNVDFDPGAGAANLSSAGSTDIFIAKYDAAGNYAWAKRVGGSSFDGGNSLAIDGNGNVCVTGYFAGTNVDFDPGAGTANLSATTNNEVFAAKYDASGNYVWAGRAGSYARGRGLALDGNNNVLVTGFFQFGGDFDPGAGTANLRSGYGGSDIFVLRWSSAGAYNWAVNLGANGSQPNGMICKAVARDASGNVYATGSFSGEKVDFDPGPGTAYLSSAGNASDIFVAKYAAAGNCLWAIRVGGLNTDEGTDLAVDGSGNVYVTGSFYDNNVDFDPGPGTALLPNTGNGDGFFAKYDASGNYVWAKTCASGTANWDSALSIALDGSGNVYLTGVFYGNNVDFDPGPGTALLNSAGSTDIFLSKYDPSGNYLWAIRAGGASGEGGRALEVDGSGNVYVTGLLSSANVDFDPGAGTALLSAGGQDVFLAKYDASGNYVWAFKIGNTGSDDGFGLALDGSGNVLVSGVFSGINVDFDPGAGTAYLSSSSNFDLDIFIAKYDAAGSYLWAKRIGGPNTEVCFGLALDAGGNIYTTGSFSGTAADFDPGPGTATLNSAGFDDFFIARYDASGNYVWATGVGGPSTDYGYCVAAGSGNKVNVGGYFYGTVDFDPCAGTANRTAVASGGDIFIAQYDATPRVSEIDVKGNGQSIANGDVTPAASDATDFGGVCVDGGSNAVTFTIENACPPNLTLAAGSITIGGPNAADFSLSGISLPAAIAPGSSTTFTMTFDPSGTGLRAATVSIASNDDDENPYMFAIQGTGNASPACSIAGGPAVVCANSTGHVYTVAGGGTYTWSIDGNGAIIGGNTGAAVTVNAAAAGTFTITVTITNNGCTSTCSKTVTVGSCPDFSGVILWEHDNSGIQNAAVNLSGSFTGSDLTDINGYFSIATNVPSGNFTLKPVKNNNKLNGVDAADIVAIQQHVAAINPITNPFKLVCADVNKTNTITALDASLIQQVMLGNPSANLQFSSSWRFVPTSHTMSMPPWGFPEQRIYMGVSGSQTNQNFTGMKIGDVVATWANPANFGAGEPLVLRAGERVLRAGETFDLAFSAGQLDDLAAFQFTLSFDPARLRFEALEPIAGGLPLGADHFGTLNAAEGELRVVWSQATGLAVADATPAFRLRFTALESGASLSDALALAPEDSALPGRAYNSRLEESGVQLHLESSTGTNGPGVGSANFRLLQNRPNPFSDRTTVGFVLPAAGAAQLRVLDVNGREVARVAKNYPAGYSEEVLRLDGASGVLYLELTTPWGVVGRKMVAVE